MVWVSVNDSFKEWLGYGGVQKEAPLSLTANKIQDY